MRDELISAAFRVWRMGKEPGRPIRDLIAIDTVLQELNGGWTPEERATIKDMIARNRD